MKKFFQFLKTKPIPLASLAFIAALYVVMVFAPFFAPCPPTRAYERNTFHPANVRITRRGIVAQECRVIDPVKWKYARVKGKFHKVNFFARGESWKIFGLVPCDRHLFGTRSDGGAEPYPAYLLGADNLGRDLFSRIVYGSRISLTIGFVASAVSLALAVIIGGLAGYYGGAADAAMMRAAEFFMLIPGLYLILFLRSLLNASMDSGASYMVITVILALVGWPGSARSIRGMVHSIKNEEFVVDARLEGIPSISVIFRHVIPQMASLLIVSVALSVPGFIMSETTLSYLGLGIADPAVSWGSLINRDISTLSNLRSYPWLLSPVWLLLAVTLAFNFFGDALRDYFDPYHAVFRTFRRRAKKEKERAVADGAEASEKRAFLSVEDLRVTFSVLRGSRVVMARAVRGVSFSMRRGEVLGVVGESGSGKSVTTTAIPGLLPANARVSGKIFFEGTDLLSLDAKGLREYRGKKISMIYQEPGRSFDPLQKIGDVFLETFRVVDRSISKDESDEKACALLSDVGLPDPRGRLSNFPHQFSGGQLQRIGIALALAQGSELLIADEPTTSLDVTIQAQIVTLLMRLKKERGLSIIFISHNIDVVSRIADRVIVMYGGMIMEEGDAARIVSRARHPYTKALLASSPKFGEHYTERRMETIPGRVSDAASPPDGCPFEPRCRQAAASCRASAACHVLAQGAADDNRG